MEIKKIAVSRTIEVPGQKDSVERKTNVNVRFATTGQEMVELAGSLEKALEFFNDGRWAPIRTQVSNALAGKSVEQKAVDRMVAAFKTMNPALTDEAARTMVLSMPGMEAASQVTTEILPPEIDDTYFEAKKAAKETVNA